MKKIGVILSGCGFKDGAEIQESVFSLLAIDQSNALAVCMAPDIEVPEINHLTMSTTGKKINVLQESARIARGNIVDIKSVKEKYIISLCISFILKLLSFFVAT